MPKRCSLLSKESKAAARSQTVGRLKEYIRKAFEEGEPARPNRYTICAERGLANLQTDPRIDRLGFKKPSILAREIVAS
jgi:hypothetical protein